MSEFQQTMKTVQFTLIPTVVNNKPSNNIAVMIGILHVAFIEEQPDGQWKIKVVWEHAFPYGTDLYRTKPEALAKVKQLLLTSTNT
jgi:hypothetical protein